MDQPRSLTADFSPALAPQGTPHWWLDRRGEVANGDYAAAEMADPDGNGLSAAQEFIIGEAKGKPFSLALSPVASSATPGVRLRWQGRSGRKYALCMPT